jgi:hypothetical protein
VVAGGGRHRRHGGGGAEAVSRWERECGGERSGAARRRTGAWSIQSVGAFARVTFIARAAADASILPRGIARNRGRGKFFTARAFFPRLMGVRAGARACQTGGLFAARALCRVCWRCS